MKYSYAQNFYLLPFDNRDCIKYFFADQSKLQDIYAAAGITAFFVIIILAIPTTHAIKRAYSKRNEISNSV